MLAVGTLPWRRAPIDLERLARALDYDAVWPAGAPAGVYRVTPMFLLMEGGDGGYDVDLRPGADALCDCGDHTMRETLCKHALAALIAERDERVTAALRGLGATL